MKNPTERKHSHYYKDVSDVAQIDVYAVLRLFEVTDPCLQHIVKKALCAGKRGAKGFAKDVQEIADTAQRLVELESENAARTSCGASDSTIDSEVLRYE